MGKRSVVGLKSGLLVANSSPVLRRPTTPVTAGRKPEASPPSSQPKSWRGRGGGATAEEIAREARGPELDELSVSALIRFFELLDRWDQGAKHETEIV